MTLPVTEAAPSEAAPLRAARLLAADPSPEGARKALEAIGIRFPFALEVDVTAPDGLPELPSGPVMMKVVDPVLPHKTEVGAVRAADGPDADALLAFARDVEARIGEPVRKVRLEERLSVPEGGEALLSALWDDAFGPVACFGEGGRMTEVRRGVTRWLPGLPADLESMVAGLPLAKPWLEGFRGAPPLVERHRLYGLLADFATMVAEFDRLSGDRVLRDLEINPLALTAAGPVALDLLLEFTPRPMPGGPRPDLDRLARSMGQARQVTVVGPSTTDSESLGRVLYDRLVRDFQGETRAVNPRGGEIAGKPVFPSVSALPEAPDLLVLAIPAARTAETLREARERFGEDLGAVLMLASGFDETRRGQEGGEELRREVRAMGSTPVLGPNTMGLYSQAGNPGDVKVDFLPPGRLDLPSFPDARSNNLALVLQSGARFASFVDRQSGVGLRWAIMVGNAYQADAADGVELAARDPGVQAVAVYLEGFGPEGGRRLAEAVRRCSAAGKIVVLQKGGRTEAGAATARSHTASMSGSHDLFCAAMAQAGGIVAECETDFLDVTRVASLLGGRRPHGNRVFLINGAGYEGVLAADEAARQGLELPPPSRMTDPQALVRTLEGYLKGVLEGDRNPADVGPATPDGAYAEAVAAALADPLYDVAVVAIMPHGNGMKGTLPPYDGEGLLGPLLAELAAELDKPMVVSVNGGPRYEGFRRFLEDRGVPVLPDSERAMRALGLWVAHRLTWG